MARRPGESADPYRVWLSEIMLQQTTVAAVKAISSASGALADRRRPRRGADRRRDGGMGGAWLLQPRPQPPRRGADGGRAHSAARSRPTEAALRALPGVGAYTAAAIAAIAFGQATMPVDANIERVVARLFADEAPLPAVKPRPRRAGVPH